MGTPCSRGKELGVLGPLWSKSEVLFFWTRVWPTDFRVKLWIFFAPTVRIWSSWFLEGELSVSLVRCLSWEDLDDVFKASVVFVELDLVSDPTNGSKTFINEIFGFRGVISMFCMSNCCFSLGWSFNLLLLSNFAGNDVNEILAFSGVMFIVCISNCGVKRGWSFSMLFSFAFSDNDVSDTFAFRGVMFIVWSSNCGVKCSWSFDMLFSVDFSGNDAGGFDNCGALTLAVLMLPVLACRGECWDTTASLGACTGSATATKAKQKVFMNDKLNVLKLKYLHRWFIVHSFLGFSWL